MPSRAAFYDKAEAKTDSALGEDRQARRLDPDRGWLVLLAAMVIGDLIGIASVF